MHHHEKIDEEEPAFSPLNLLYTAYTDQQPTINQVITEHFRALELYFAPLSQQEQHTFFQSLCQICSEKERLAFFAGVRVGARLKEEFPDI